ncbi:16S rRNA (cytidine(1402)-2'-O)-methyltransferase [Mycoplasmatota bacterium WC44]
MVRRNLNYHNSKSTLYLVSTPIGNLEDITLRAINTLNSVDLIFCEDTRVTQKLLNHLEIKKKVYSYHEHNKEVQGDFIIELLIQGKNIALVSDAGMPIISDPGFEVTKLALENEFNVVPIPGANAALTALIASGIAPKPFTYYGFLDHKQSKKKQQLEELKEITHTLIFYESIHRIRKTLEAILDIFGDRDIVIGRELTKKFEEFTYGKVSEVVNEVENLKGELVLIVSGNDEVKSFELDIKSHIQEFITSGETPTNAIKKVAKLRGVTKRDVYNEYHDL